MPNDLKNGLGWLFPSGSVPWRVSQCDHTQLCCRGRSSGNDFSWVKSICHHPWDHGLSHFLPFFSLISLQQLTHQLLAPCLLSFLSSFWYPQRLCWELGSRRKSRIWLPLSGKGYPVQGVPHAVVAERCCLSLSKLVCCWPVSPACISPPRSPTAAGALTDLSVLSHC